MNRKAKYRLPAGFDENALPDSIMDQMREDGTAWAYELAESVAMHSKFLGLIKVHIDVKAILTWHESILQWPEDAVGDAQRWRQRIPPVGAAFDVPLLVRKLVHDFHVAFGSGVRGWRARNNDCNFLHDISSATA